MLVMVVLLALALVIALYAMSLFESYASDIDGTQWYLAESIRDNNLLLLFLGIIPVGVAFALALALLSKLKTEAAVAAAVKTQK